MYLYQRCPQHFHIHPIRTHDKRAGRVLGYFKKTLPCRLTSRLPLPKTRDILFLNQHSTRPLSRQKGPNDKTFPWALSTRYTPTLFPVENPRVYSNVSPRKASLVNFTFLSPSSRYPPSPRSPAPEKHYLFSLFGQHDTLVFRQFIKAITHP